MWTDLRFYILGAHDQGAGGSPNGPSVMSHLDYAKDVNQKGRFEEIFMHEASHACIDYINKGKRYDVRTWFTKRFQVFTYYSIGQILFSIITSFNWLRLPNGGKLCLLITENLSRLTLCSIQTEKMFQKAVLLGMQQGYERIDNLLVIFRLQKQRFQIEWITSIDILVSSVFDN